MMNAPLLLVLPAAFFAGKLIGASGVAILAAMVVIVAVRLARRAAAP